MMFSIEDCKSIEQELDNLQSAVNFNINVDNDSIEEQLYQLRSSGLNRYSIVKTCADGKSVRIFKNINIDATDAWMRGIDGLRAAVFIFKLNQWPLDDLVTLSNGYQALLDQSLSIDEMIKEVRRLYAILAIYLSQNQPSLKPNTAMHQLQFIRDFLWTGDFAKPYARLERIDNNYIVHLVEPLAFDPENLPLWKNLGRQTWFLELKVKLGSPSWLHQFVAKHGRAWKLLSPTPMSRGIPNPANAWYVRDYELTDDSCVLIGHGLSSAISEPVDLKDALNREVIHVENNVELFSSSLKNPLAQWVDTFGCLYQPDEPYEVNIVHQTLVGDDVALSPDQKKANEGSVIDRKSSANDALRDYIAKHQLIYSSTKRECFKINKENLKKAHPNADLHAVDIHLYDSNHCINMWGNRRGRIRDVDVNTPREYITKACKLFSRIQSSNQQDKDDLLIIIKYLNSRDHGIFDSLKYRPKAIDDALMRLSSHLTNKDNHDLNCPFQTRLQLAMGLQAAVELKSLVHETFAGSIRRRLANLSRDYLRADELGFFADLGVRFGLFVLSSTKWLNPWHWRAVKHNHGHRKPLDMAVYEALLVESTGILFGGCMSAVDRKGELMEQVMAHRRHFLKHGRIFSLKNDRKAYETFLQDYGNTINKHTHALMATGTAGTKDHELTGRVYWHNRLIYPFASYRSPTLSGQEPEELYQSSTEAAKLREVSFKKPATSTQRLWSSHQSATPQPQRPSQPSASR